MIKLALLNVLIAHPPPVNPAPPNFHQANQIEQSIKLIEKAGMGKKARWLQRKHAAGKILVAERVFKDEPNFIGGRFWKGKVYIDTRLVFSSDLPRLLVHESAHGTAGFFVSFWSDLVGGLGLCWDLEEQYARRVHRRYLKLTME